MFLEASKRLGLSALLLGLTFLVVLFSAWCATVHPSIPSFPLIEKSLLTMLFFGVIIGPVGATVGIVIATFALFVPLGYKKKDKPSES